MSWRAARAVAAAEWTRTLRDRPSLSLLVLLPVLQIVLFGFAVRLEPTRIPVAVIGTGIAAERAAGEVVMERRLRLLPRDPVETPEEALRRGAALAIVARAGAPVRLVADGADPVAARGALAAAQGRLLAGAARAFPLNVPRVEVEWAFNPDGGSARVLVPVLGGVVVTVVMLLLGAQALVREREEGGWEALRLTAAPGWAILGGKLAPYLAFAVAQQAVVLACGAALFELPLGAGAAALLALTVPFAAAHLAWGLALSAAAGTRLQAVQGAVLLYLPSMLLSGFLFPFAAMPAWARAVGEALPLTHFARASRDALLRGDPGAGLAHAPPMLAAAAAGFAAALIAWRRART